MRARGDRCGRCRAARGWQESRARPAGSEAQMSAGELRERIAFDRRALISDGYGNEQGDWEEQFIRWGRLRPRLGGEQVMAARLQGVQPYTIKVWFDNKTRQIG